jgi:nucleoside-diphosphate-sugar epimerase
MGSQKTVAVVGGTGGLGHMIVEALLGKPEVRVRLLVRPGSREKAGAFESRQAEIVEGDIGPGGEAPLASLCAGAFSVVSAVQGGPDIIIEGQRRVLAAARAASVRRFIPSDYSMNFFRLEEGENTNSDSRRGFARISERERGATEVVHVLNGCLLDRRVLFGFLGAIDLKSQTAYLWGDGDQPMDFTTYEDTSRFIAEVATDESPVPEVFNVAGDVLTFHELVRAYETASGKRLKVERQGSLADLDAIIAQRQRENPSNIFGYLPLMYYRGMLNGKGKLDSRMNDRYPGIRTTSVQEYVARERL